LIRERYDWKIISDMWKNFIDSRILNQIIHEEEFEKKPIYFCMISTKKSQKYTYKSLETFAKNTKLKNTDKFFLIDNDNTFPYQIEGVNLIANKTPKSFAENVNQILSKAIEDNVDFVLCSNDVIFTENWLEPLINSDSITLPLCNQYITDKTDKFEILPAMDLVQYIENEQELDILAKKITDQKLKFNQPKHISFYCFYLPYKVSSVVGLFDEKFGKGGGEDVDYRLRSHIKGFETKLVSESYVLHFMGKSTWRGGETQEEIKQRNKVYYEHFVSKWGKETADELLHTV